MATITVLHNQSFQDIAIQKTGNVLNAFSIAVFNGMAVSDQLEPGTDLLLPEEMEIDVDVLNYYASKQLQPATSFRDKKAVEKRGIGVMRIGGNFKVD
ncbi:MAG: hypothetical protein RR604_08720 [Eubacterium sp.]